MFADLLQERPFSPTVCAKRLSDSSAVNHCVSVGAGRLNPDSETTWFRYAKKPHSDNAVSQDLARGLFMCDTHSSAGPWSQSYVVNAGCWTHVEPIASRAKELSR
jgi:hypothetical protein